jgi:L-gulonate 5-dehydrogenase
MKALVYTDLETLTYQDMPMPPLDGDNVLIKVMASGICGSDMHAFLGQDERRHAPLTLGHEAAGIVVGGPEDGRRVTINPLVTCGKCEACKSGRTNLCADRQIISMPPREGAFAEYLTIPRKNLVTIPDDVAFTTAALAEPLACGWHGVRLAHQAIGGPLTNKQCLVIGGGAIGLGAALALFAFGARNIALIEPNALRRETLLNIQGFAALHPDDSEVPNNGTVDIVIDAVGYAATRADACRFAKPGGVIVHIGLAEATGGLDIRRMTLQEIQFIGTYTYTARDFIDTATAMFRGELGVLDWTECRPLSQGQSAFLDIRAGCVASPKIILIPEHEE